MAVVGRPHGVLELQFGCGAVRRVVTGSVRTTRIVELQLDFGRAGNGDRFRKRRRDFDRVVLHVLAIVAGIRGDRHALNHRDGGGNDVFGDSEYAGKRQVARLFAARTRMGRPAQGVGRGADSRRGTGVGAERLIRGRAVIGRAGANGLIPAVLRNYRAVLQCRGEPVSPGTVVEVGVVIRNFRAVQPIDRHAAASVRAGMAARVDRGGRAEHLEMARIRLDFRVADGADAPLHIRVIDRDVRRVRRPRIFSHGHQAKTRRPRPVPKASGASRSKPRSARMRARRTTR